MSVQRDRFAAEVAKPQPDWETAVDNLGLAMFEMLPALAAAQPVVRAEVVRQARRILVTQRGWQGAFDRIDFAADVVNDWRLTSWPQSLPDAQVEDARNFLIDLLKPANSGAGRTLFPTADAAAIAAIDEISPTTNAIRIEFSGSIFQRGSSFSFTPPERGEATSSNANVPVPAGTRRIGPYHTHPDVNKNAENFSPEDLMICRSGQFIFYLGTPSGRIKKLIPPSLLTGAEKKQFGLLGHQIIVR